jgi:hypothetical protein
MARLQSTQAVMLALLSFCSKKVGNDLCVRNFKHVAQLLRERKESEAK